MTENYFEYAVEEKATGKNLIRRVLLILFYLIFSLAFFIAFSAIKIPQLIALLPLLLFIMVALTWRYVSVTHEYIIAVGEISFVNIYAGRKRKEILKLSVREAEEIAPDEGKTLPAVDKVYDFRSSPSTPDSYYLVFKDGKEKRCLVYFEATRKALKLLQLYNPGAVKQGKTLRY